MTHFSDFRRQNWHLGGYAVVRWHAAGSTFVRSVRLAHVTRWRRSSPPMECRVDLPGVPTALLDEGDFLGGREVTHGLCDGTFGE